MLLLVKIDSDADSPVWAIYYETEMQATAQKSTHITDICEGFNVQKVGDLKQNNKLYLHSLNQGTEIT